MQTTSTRPRGLSPRRVAAGLLLAACALPALTWFLSGLRGDIAVSTSLALYLLTVVLVSAVGGSVPGLMSALAAPLLANWYLIAPYHTLRISDAENLVELVVFVSTAAVVSGYVSSTARRQSEADDAWREAGILASLATSSNLDAVGAILDLMRETFGFDSVVLRESGEPTRVTAASGMPTPARATFTRHVTDDYVLLADGPELTTSAHRVVEAFVDRLALALEQRRLREKALEADALARADELRTAILRSVSHDLRSPLAGIKASVSSLRQEDVEWSQEDRADFLASIESETDRLTRIVANLLDMSRLESGVLRPAIRRVSLEEVVPAVVHGLGDDAANVRIDIPEDLPDAWADSALLERVVENLVVNALKWTPHGAGVEIVGSHVGHEVVLSIADHGPGIPESKRRVVTQPFHRLDDAASPGGLGLGLAIVDRMVTAMGGTLGLGDTPGGGLTARVSLRRIWTDLP